MKKARECGLPFDGVKCDRPTGHEDVHSYTLPPHLRVPAPQEAPEYESLRVKSNIGVRGFSSSGIGGGQINSGGGTQIMFRPSPFPHFEVTPSGIQIPLDNVASATPKGCGAGAVRKRTTADRLNKRAFLESRATRTKPPVVAEAEEVDDA